MTATLPFQKLCETIPGGVNSPVRAFQGVPVEPMIVAHAQGAELTDLADRQFFDFCCSWGALLLGHAPPEVVDAVQAQLPKGTSYGVTSMLEERVASRLIANVPSLERVRLVSTGTEATMSAIRVARAATNRELVIKFDGCYHGHSDGLLVKAGSGFAQMGPQAASQGVPKEWLRATLSLPYNDVGAVEAEFQRRGDQIAAVILEPIAGNMGVVPAHREFLYRLRALADAYGAVLIFDEVITGFRVAKGGAQALYGVVPDLTCLGKVIGGGFPVAAFGGRRAMMELLAPLGPVFQAGTLSGNAVAMAAAEATLQVVEQEGFYAELEKRAALFCQPLAEALQNIGGCLQRVGSMWSPFFGRASVSNFQEAKATDTEAFCSFYAAAYKEGIFLPPSPYEAAFIGRCHDEHKLCIARDFLCSFIASLRTP